jgi:hypothetical protein
VYMIVEPLHLNLDVVDPSKSSQVCSAPQLPRRPPRLHAGRVVGRVVSPAVGRSRSAVFLVRALILGALFAYMRRGTQSVNKIIRLINVEGQRVAFKIRTTARNMFSTTPNCGLLLPGQVMHPARVLVL